MVWKIPKVRQFHKIGEVGKWNHLSVTYSRSTRCTKNYRNRRILVQVIVDDVVTCFFPETQHTCVCKWVVFWWCWAEEPRETASTLFDQLEAEDSKCLMSLPPSNAFEEMIRWTEEGKLWTFPIDNELGAAASLFSWYCTCHLYIVLWFILIVILF